MTLRDAGLTSQSIVTVSSALVENNVSDAFRAITLAVVRKTPVEIVNVKVKPSDSIAYVRALVVKSTAGGVLLRPCGALEHGSGEILRDETKVSELLSTSVNANQRLILKETEVESSSHEKQQVGAHPLQRTGLPTYS